MPSLQNIPFDSPLLPKSKGPFLDLHQQKWILHQICRHSLLKQATYFLLPLRPIHADLRHNVPCVLTQPHILPTSRPPQTLDLVASFS